jgi:hypothetical protein
MSSLKSSPVAGGRAAALRRVLAADQMPVPEDPADLRSELDVIRGERFA